MTAPTSPVPKPRPEDLGPLIVALAPLIDLRVIDSVEVATRYWRAGWTPADVAAVEAMAERAQDLQAPVATTALFWPVTPTLTDLFSLFTGFRDRLVSRWHADPSTAVAWVGLMASAQTMDAAMATERLLNNTRSEHLHLMQEWARLGPVGAVAWAAGLTVAEAQAYGVTATNVGGEPGADPEGGSGDLVTLAALRGWRLPTVSETRTAKDGAA